jgi:hypothetical protein
MSALSCKSIEKAKTKDDKDKVKSKAIPEKHVLAKLAMLRWDELNELALHLKTALADANVITKDVLKTALLEINDSKSRGLGEYCRFRLDPVYERFDASRKAVWVIKGIEGLAAGTEAPRPVETVNGSLIVRATVGPMSNVEVPGFGVEAASEKGEAGRIRLRKS